jgi:hypothetical protein
VVLNLSAMIANGGAMPAPAQFGFEAQSAAQPVNERVAPGTKDRLFVSGAPAAVQLLSDHILITLPTGSQRVASIGDFFILAGGILALVLAVGPTGSNATRATDVLALPNQ